MVLSGHAEERKRGSGISHPHKKTTVTPRPRQRMMLRALERRMEWR